MEARLAEAAADGKEEAGRAEAQAEAGTTSRRTVRQGRALPGAAPTANLLKRRGIALGADEAGSDRKKLRLRTGAAERDWDGGFGFSERFRRRDGTSGGFGLCGMPELFEAAAGEEASVSLPNPPGTAAGLPGVNGRLPRECGLPLDRRRPGDAKASAGACEGLLESASGVRPVSDGGKPREARAASAASPDGSGRRRGGSRSRSGSPDGKGRRFGAAPDPPRGSNGLRPAREPPAQRDAAPAGGPWSWDSGGRWQHRPPLRIRLQVVLGAGRGASATARPQGSQFDPEAAA